ncbi:hypothetical protein EDD18DRAFT_1106140 [Armillaria luteobubalina]|uniref:F-box domain-containing protein n=1 Tax=Armillaria luteobubalina TaxID=153913 RepID=A0AA39UNF3_9AGAR|nr:hypothetical protein EDD18DRAFT_1106140 [Armillaria luteobubalina]
MSVAYFGCVLATPNAFGLLEYKALTDLVDHVEADLSFTDIIETYNNGTHPYFKYLSSILALSDADGDSFCGAMMRILQRFENKYPQVVVSNIALPSASMPESTGERSTLWGRLPQELLERIMSFCSTYDLKVSRFVCREWCFAASRYSHAAIVFRMNTNWQFWVCTSEGKKNAELYAFAAECIVFYIASKYHRSPRLSDMGDARSWLTMLGVFPTSPTGQFEYAPPSVRRLDLHFPDDPAPIRSTATDLRGTPPLLFQLFPEDPRASEQLYFLWDDKAFPVRLRSTVIDELEVRWTPHMAFVFPRVVRCTGNNLSTLSMFFRGYHFWWRSL